MGQPIKIKLTIISPLSIGNGVEYSPYRDYVVEGRKLLYLDIHKLEQKIATSERLMDKYVNGIGNGMENNRSNFELKTFLHNDLKSDIHSFCRQELPILSHSPQSKIPIKTTIKTPLGMPYIPGSSIKGALKTVLLYDWLYNEDLSAQQWKDQFIAACAQLQRGTDHNGDHKIINKHCEKIKESYKSLETELKKITKAKDYTKESLCVSDTENFPKESLCVVDCDRKAPLRIECINSGACTTFSLSCEYEWEDLREKINSYSQYSFEKEKNLINPKDKEYKDFVNNICQNIETANANTAYLRLGFGKGYFLNSIGLELFDAWVEGKENSQEKNLLENFILMHFPKQFKDIDHFPQTRIKIDKNQEGLGWVKLEKL